MGNRSKDDEGPEPAEGKQPRGVGSTDKRTGNQARREQRWYDLQEDESTFGNIGAGAHIAKVQQHPRIASAKPPAADRAEGERVAGDGP